MRRWMFVVALAAGLGTAGVATPAPKKGSKLAVKTVSARLLKGPGLLSPQAGPVDRGAVLIVLGTKGDFYQVKAEASGVEGWIYRTDVVEAKAGTSSAASSGGATGVSQEEAELAARGFNRGVEDDYRQKNPTLDFGMVDKIDRLSEDQDALAAFAVAGELGGAK